MNVPVIQGRLLTLICLITILLHLALFWERTVLSVQTLPQHAVEVRAPSTQTIKSSEEADALRKSLQDVVGIARDASNDPSNAHGLLEALGRIVDLANEAAGGTAFPATFQSARGKEDEVSGGTATEMDAGGEKNMPSFPLNASISENLIRLVEQQSSAMDLPLNPSRKKLRLFVGVFTGFNDPGRKENLADRDRYNYQKRRHALRETWFPGTVEERSRLEEKGIVVRFIVGHTNDAKEEQKMNEEEKQNNDIMRLPIQESYYGLTNKTKTFFATAAMTYDADWVVKVDDDVYLMVERILLAAEQWEKMGAGYIGCMKHGYVWKEEKSRWFEPDHLLLGQEYYLHAYGSIYVLAKKTILDVILRNFSNLRFLSNEDTTVGSWMLGHNITHFEDMRLCATRCSDAAIGILKNECAGLCNPLKDLYLVHNAQSCKSRLPGPLAYLPSYPDHTAFEAMRV